MAPSNDVTRSATEVLTKIEDFRTAFATHHNNKKKKNAPSLLRRAVDTINEIARFINFYRGFAMLVFSALSFVSRHTNARVKTAILEALRHVALPHGMTPLEFFEAYWPWAQRIVPPPPPPSQPSFWTSLAWFGATLARKTAVAPFKVSWRAMRTVGCFFMDMALLAWLPKDESKAWYRNAIAASQLARCHAHVHTPS